MDPVLIVKTSEQGAALLRSLVDPSLDLSHVKSNGLLATTVSIEVEHEGRRVNLMVSDSGSARDFSIDDLDEHDIDAIRRAELVALLCLNHNQAPADLARELFSLVRSESRAITFMDAGDPSSRPHIVGPLCEEVLSEGLVDVLSVNENEVIWFARASGFDVSWTSQRDTLLQAARHITNEFDIRVDLHTPLFTSTHSHDDEAVASTFEAAPQVTCGAGDTWNAGDIYGYLSGLPSMERLMLANAVAALYVSSPSADHPTRDNVASLLCERCR